MSSIEKFSTSREQAKKTFEQELDLTHQENQEVRDENRIEKIKLVFQESLEVFYNPEISLWEGAITVMRKRSDKRTETIDALVCVDMNEDGPDLAGIDEEGEPTASATMLWKEIADAKKMDSAKVKPQ
ncbi:MAG: hypothetical protein WC831_00560 [Parcubacteria group bacterium]|jgi:hypothetical protein